MSKLVVATLTALLGQASGQGPVCMEVAYGFSTRVETPTVSASLPTSSLFAFTPLNGSYSTLRDFAYTPAAVGNLVVVGGKLHQTMLIGARLDNR